MLGVMEGAASDLRTGLYLQMVEIHEPMRILFLIETTPQIMLKIIKGNEAIRVLCEGGWVQLAIVNPMDGKVSLYSAGEFVPHAPTIETLPLVQCSKDWYAGHRNHLGIVQLKGVQQ